MPTKKQIFLESGPGHLTAAVDWSNIEHQRSVVASLVQGVYVLDHDRLQHRRDTDQALAPPWWESFKFQLDHEIIDNGSIVGAIYKYKDPSPAPKIPQYVIAFRGKLIQKDTWLQDFKCIFKCVLNDLHQDRFQLAMDNVQEIVTMSEDARVWLAGHSLGSAMALFAGKNMAKMGHFLETYLLHPPFLSVPIESWFNDELRSAIHLASTTVHACLNLGLNDDHQAHDPFVVLSPWVPHLFVNRADFICSGYTGHFEERMKMEEKGFGKLERIAAKKSKRSLFLSMLGRDSSPELLHLLPSANLTINSGQFPDFEGVLAPYKKFKRAHGIEQWWNSDPCESVCYKYSAKYSTTKRTK